MNIPYGKPAWVGILEPAGSKAWRKGIRMKTYQGTICVHHDINESRTCIQPVNGQCVPFDPKTAQIQLLRGKLSDYS